MRIKPKTLFSVLRWESDCIFLWQIYFTTVCKVYRALSKKNISEYFEKNTLRIITKLLFTVNTVSHALTSVLSIVHGLFWVFFFYIACVISFCPQPSSEDACPALRPVQASTCPMGTTRTMGNHIYLASSLCSCGRSHTPRPATALSACSRTTWWASRTFASWQHVFSSAL